MRTPSREQCGGEWLTIHQAPTGHQRFSDRGGMNTDHVVPEYESAMSIQSSNPSLPLADYKRYGRQMILNGVGLPGAFPIFPPLSSLASTHATPVQVSSG